MKNITVAVPEHVYRVARVVADEQDTSVSALVVRYLERLSFADKEFERLEALQHRVQSEITDFRGGDRLTRDEVHDVCVHTVPSVTLGTA